MLLLVVFLLVLVLLCFVGLFPQPLLAGLFSLLFIHGTGILEFVYSNLLVTRVFLREFDLLIVIKVREVFLFVKLLFEEFAFLHLEEIRFAQFLTLEASICLLMLVQSAMLELKFAHLAENVLLLLGLLFLYRHKIGLFGIVA